MNRTSWLLAVLLASAGSAASAAALAPGLTNIGIAAAVRGAASAVAPGQAVGRNLTSGKPVYLNDHVTTGPDGRMQLLLLDQTVFTIGPDSDMVLDEFVYDPATSAGKVSAQIVKGAFRFVTGKIAQRKPSDMKVALPVGTIGIRGTIVAGRVHGRDADVFLLGPGPRNDAQERRGGISVTGAGRTVDINESGYGTSIRNGGSPVSGYRFAVGQMNSILDELDSKTAANGVRGISRDLTLGSGSATRESGQATALGGLNFQTTAGNIAAQLPDTQNFASQQTQAQASDLENGIATWSQMLSIPAGTGQYTGSGLFSSSEGAGTMTVDLNVDFGAKTIGGGGSTINLSVGENFSDSTGVNTVSYSGKTGPASGLSLTSALTNGNFTGADVTFYNKGGQIGGQSVITATYSSGTTGHGSVTATLAPGSAPNG